MIRILHITEMLSAAGIESFIMNLYRRVDRSKVQFDFFVLRNKHEFYEDEIQEMGGKKYFANSTKKNTLFRIYEECKLLKKFLSTHHYDIVHVHYTTPLRAPYLQVLKKMGVKTRIYHSHSAFVAGKGLFKSLIYSYMRKKIEKYATHYFACSNAAAEWIFTKKMLRQGQVKIIHNGIDTSIFAYNESVRKETRLLLGIDEKKVIIHTGRFSEQKNQLFVVNVFAALKKKCPNTVLLLLGEGPLQETVKQKSYALGVEKDVVFLGVKSDVFRYLNAADCYMMPSLYEGLPVAAIEAQCAGLPCVFSTNITKEVDLTEKSLFLSLDSSFDVWADCIIKCLVLDRKDCSYQIQLRGYDMQKVATEMQKFYLSTME